MVATFNPDELEQAIKAWSEAPREEQDAYYYELIWPLIRRLWEQQPAPSQRFEVLIIPVSVLYSAAFNLIHYRPAAVVPIYTERSRAEHATRLQELAVELGIEYDDDGRTVDANDTLAIYQAVKDAYVRYHGERIAVDITGGTKAMSVGAALAGAVIGADSIYVESTFDRHIQDRRPGTERGYVLPGPYAVLGDIERERAFDVFAGHDYPTAQELFGRLASRVKPPHGDVHWSRLARAYVAWERFDLAGAEADLRGLREDRDKPPGLVAAQSRLVAHVRTIKVVRPLVELVRPSREDRSSWGNECSFAQALRRELGLRQDARTTGTLLAMLYTQALRRATQQRWDAAVLLLYRCVELMGQQRLACLDLLTDRPREGLQRLQARYPDLDVRYAASAQQLFDGYSDLPIGKPTLITGYLILQAVDDEFTRALDLVALRDQIDARNASILAHGFRPVTEQIYHAFASLVRDAIRIWCLVAQQDWVVYETACTFICPPEA